MVPKRNRVILSPDPHAANHKSMEKKRCTGLSLLRIASQACKLQLCKKPRIWCRAIVPPLYKHMNIVWVVKLVLRWIYFHSYSSHCNFTAIFTASNGDNSPNEKAVLVMLPYGVVMFAVKSGTCADFVHGSNIQPPRYVYHPTIRTWNKAYCFFLVMSTFTRSCVGWSKHCEQYQDLKVMTQLRHLTLCVMSRFCNLKSVLGW